VKIRITMTIDPEYEDAGHEMGITSDGYNIICDRLGELGDNIDVSAEPS
jgi:hypothetical protein